MLNPDQALIRIPANLVGKEGRSPLSSLNPFQLRTFLDLHKSYDNFIRSSKFKEFLFKEPIEVDLEETTRLLKQSIERNHTAYDIEKKTTPIIAYTIAGKTVFDEATIERYKKLMELSVRGLMDVDHNTFELIYKYFERYSLGLGLSESSEWIDSDDRRFISNTPEFSELSTSLFGFHLSAIGFPNAEQYSELNWQAFINQVKSRVEKVVGEMK